MKFKKSQERIHEIETTIMNSENKENINEDKKNMKMITAIKLPY